MDRKRAPTGIVGEGRATLWEGGVHRLGATGSTMEEAGRLAVAGAAHGTAVVAAEQHGGRGRSGRAWVSPVGNLHATVVLRPGGEARHAPQLGFLVAVAVAEAVDQLAGPGTALKWPNDVLRGQAKLAGILMERLDDGAVLAGIGMNVRHSPSGLPYKVTSLHALGCRAEVDDALEAVLAALSAGWGRWCAGGLAPVLQRWATRGPALGVELAVRLGDAVLNGRFAGLRADGALLLDQPSGQRALVAGEVQPCARSPGMAKTAPC